MASQCDLCAYYWIDEEDGTGEFSELDEELSGKDVVRLIR